MSKILGVNTSHNCSFAVLTDNILTEYYEEDRFNKIKHYCPDPDGDLEYEYEILKKFKDITFDCVVINSHDRNNFVVEKAIIDNIIKQVKHKKYFFYPHQHHIFHALCGFYFSKFNETLALITDGGGEKLITEDFGDPIAQASFDTIESIYLVNKKSVDNFYKHLSNKRIDYFNSFIDKQEYRRYGNTDIKLSNKLCGGLKYLYYKEKAGFTDQGAEGQLMGLAAYADKPAPDLDLDALKIAKKAQEETLQERIELINKAKTYSNCKNIILSGGYHLNCSNNFKLVKKFPEFNFFVDPIAYDGGTAVGAAYYYENYHR